MEGYRAWEGGSYTLSKIKQFPKAYKEVLEILKYIPKQDYQKIPKYIIANMEKEQDMEYEYRVTEFQNFDKQEMLKETEAVLLILFREYWATEEQRNWIKDKERLEKRKIELDKIKNYTPLNDIFAKDVNIGDKTCLKENIVENNIQENQLREIERDSFMQKLIAKIKKIFKDRS